MIILLSVLWAASVASVIVIYLNYGYANYPKSWRWELLLISSSFVCGCMSGVILMIKDYNGGSFALGVLFMGCAFIVIFRFFFIHSVLRVIPKRPPPGDKDRT